jgi:membrane associated rhomboid family serine protease
MPAISAGQWWRLFASFCLHSSFAHLLSNMVLFVLLAVPLEQTYGPIRVAVIFLASAFGANFLSMTYEDPCVIYVGASGAVFGFVGLAIAGARAARGWAGTGWALGRARRGRVVQSPGGPPPSS